MSLKSVITTSIKQEMSHNNDGPPIESTVDENDKVNEHISHVFIFG